MPDTPPATDLVWAASARSGVWEDAGTDAAEDADAVRQWDLSPSGSLAQATAGNRPTYRATGLFAGPCLETDGGDYMTGPSVAIDRQNFTLAVAIYLPSNAGTQVVFGTADSFNFYVNGAVWNLYDGGANRTLPADTLILRGGLNLLVLRGTGSGLTLWVNGSSTTYAQVSVGAAASAGTVTNTFAVLGDTAGGNRAVAGAKIARAALYSSAYSDGNAELLLDWLRYAENPPELATFPKVVIFAGNSLTFGVGAAAVAADTYPEQTLALLGSTWRHTTQGWPSIQTTQMDATVYPGFVTRFFANRQRTVVVVWELTNHATLGGATAQQAHDAMESLCETYRTAAANAGAAVWIVVMGVIARGDLADGTETAINDLFLADFDEATANARVWLAAPGTTYADCFVNLRANPNLADSSDTTYFLPDGIHQKPAGGAEVAADAAFAVELAPDTQIPEAPVNTVAPSCDPTSGTTATEFEFDSGTWEGTPTEWTWEYSAAGEDDWIEFSTDENPTVAGSVFGVGEWDTLLKASNAGGTSAPATGSTITVTAVPTGGVGGVAMRGRHRMRR